MSASSGRALNTDTLRGATERKWSEVKSSKAGVRRPRWVLLAAVAGGSSAVAMGVLGSAYSGGVSGQGIASPAMSTGATITAGGSTTTTNPQNGAPVMAPVPSEELAQIPDASPGTHRH